MITSMNRNELYKTLVGHYKPNYTPDNKSAEKTAENDEKITVPEKALNIKSLSVYKDLSSEQNADRFVSSGKIDYQTYDLGTTGGKNRTILEFIPYDAKDAVNFMDSDIQLELERGYTNGVVTKERIAEYYGAMAKRLDTAYAEGKFTKDEFDELNEMIEKQVEREAYLTENKTAFYALGRKRYSLSPEAAAEIVKMEKNLTPMERLAAREQEIRDYAEKYCKIDRAALMQLFNSVRYGK